MYSFSQLRVLSNFIVISYNLGILIFILIIAYKKEGCTEEDRDFEQK